MFARKLSSIDGTIMGALRSVGDLSGPKQPGCKQRGRFGPQTLGRPPATLRLEV